MTNRPFSNPDKLTKDIADILANMSKNEQNPLPSELIKAAEEIKPKLSATSTDYEAKAMMKDALNRASKETGTVYTNQDIINFDRQARQTG